MAGAISGARGVQSLQPFILALLIVLIIIWLLLPRNKHHSHSTRAVLQLVAKNGENVKALNHTLQERLTLASVEKSPILFSKVKLEASSSPSKSAR